MKKTLSLMIILCMLLSNFALALEGDPSDWAQESVVELKEYGTFDSSVFNNFKDNITRKEFIHFAVVIYEMFTGQEITPDPSVTFNDTEDVYALKGASVGITNGIGNGNFGPDQLLTREQLAVLMMNTIKFAGIESKPATDYKFADESTFSDWAKESIYLAKANNIINGTGNEVFNPKAKATIETAMVISNRILNENKTSIVKEVPKTGTDALGFKYEIQDKKVTIVDYVGDEKDLMIPSNIEGLPVTVIGKQAFYLKELTTVEIPNSVIEISDNAFLANQIQAIEIPDSVTKIGEWAFAAIPITSLDLSEALTEIGAWAFYENQLSSVNIPSSVTKIGESAFSFNQIETLVIPDPMSEISRFAFRSYLLTTVELPSALKVINDGLFYENKIKAINLPSTITTIGEGAFYGNNLSTVNIPDTVTSIGRNAFYKNDLTSVVIPDSVIEIAIEAFMKNQLTSVEISKDCHIEEDSFDDIPTHTRDFSRELVGFLFFSLKPCGGRPVQV